MNPEAYFRPLIQLFKDHALTADARPMAAYMRNQFPFFGLKSTLRQSCTKHFFMTSGLPDLKDLAPAIHWLWQQPERELHYAAIALAVQFKKQWTKETIALFEWMIVEKSWWDTVDAISTELVGAYFKRFPDQTHLITEKWMGTDHIWLQRTALIFQRHYREKTDIALLFDYILRLKDSPEFFIQKAIGWALRAYSYTSPQQVNDFVAQTALPPLSRREALKAIHRKML